MLNFVRMMFAVVCLSINFVAHSEEICIVGREDVISKIENRTFPSVFGAWVHDMVNRDIPDAPWEWSYFRDMVSHHDLFWNNLFRGTRLEFDANTGKLQVISIGSTDYDVGLKSEITDRNPNFLYIAIVGFYGAHPERYPEDWEYWLRDKDGNRIKNDQWPEYLIDFTLPGAVEYFVQKAVAIANCGLHDGIFMDWWNEDAEFDEWMSDRYHGSKSDALVRLVKGIREAVGDNFLIIVNTNIRKIPRTASYVNGAFMETIGPAKGYSRQQYINIENSLIWYEENLRYPQVNCLEGWGIPSEPLNSDRNQQQARAIITLSLVHSDGYVSYVTGIVSQVHEHQYEIWEGHSEEHEAGKFHGHTHQKYWYDLYDADLGKPIGAKSQTYNNIDGLFIREFTHGWVVYNRSGTSQTIRFESHVSGKSSGFGGTEHVIPDLDGEIYLKTKSIDVNADGIVNILDLVIVSNSFGDTEGPADVNDDGIVNVLDLVLISNGF